MTKTIQAAAMDTPAPQDEALARPNLGQRLATHLKGPKAIPWAGLISFLETIILFLPIDVIMLPFMVINRHRVWLIATVVTLASLAAAVAGYGLSYLFFDQYGEQVITALGLTEHYPTFLEYVEKYGFWSVFLIAITPIPFKIAIIGAGATQYAFWSFCLATLLGRGGRYFTLATIAALFGPQATALYKKASGYVSPRWVQGAIVLLIALAWLLH